MSCQLLLVGDEQGLISSLDTTAAHKPPVLLHRFVAHENAIFDLKLTCDERSMITGAGDTNARVFDLATSSCTTKCGRNDTATYGGFVEHGHIGSVKCVAPHPSSPGLFVQSIFYYVIYLFI